MISSEKIRNIAIIAHVDHGKTTLVDKLLRQTSTLSSKDAARECVMDSNDIEKERGITILAKTTAIEWNGYRINIVDTPGHADFGGEVERVLSMVDSVLLVVDSVDGPMPQTRFVTKKAFAQGLKPIVVINKIDRPGADPHRAAGQVLDLFINLDGNDEQLEFPIVYASGLNGYATSDPTIKTDSMEYLLQTIIDKVSPPKVDINGPFQMQISSLDYSSFMGTIGIGRITRGRIKTKTSVSIINDDGKIRQGRILEVMTHLGLERIKVDEAGAGDIVVINGIENLQISETVCDPNHVEALVPLTVDEPTVSMTFQVNDSPFAGREGKFVTSRNIKERLERELKHNVALRVEQLPDANKFLVSGRGELHLGILIENMRREGFELAVSRPEVILKEIDGVKCEPYENVHFDIEAGHQGTITREMLERRATYVNEHSDGKGRVMLEYTAPTRALIGFQSEFLTLTSGTGIFSHSFDSYEPMKHAVVNTRKNGVLISMENGKSVEYALWKLENCGQMIIPAGIELYEGMIIGIHTRDNDLVVNPVKGKQLTNVRASGTDDSTKLEPHKILSLEQAIEFIADDELVEITPKTFRIRKKHLKETDRRRAGKG